jgi:hypothetical protein
MEEDNVEVAAGKVANRGIGLNGASVPESLSLVTAIS